MPRSSAFPIVARPPHPAGRVRRSLLRGLVAGVATLAALTAVGTDPASAARHGRCDLRGAHAISATSSARLFFVHRNEDEQWGPETHVYGCRVGRRPRLLETFDIAIAPSFDLTRFAGRYAALEVGYADIGCSKYNPNDPACSGLQIRSFDLRTGRVRATATPAAAPDGLAVGTRGWVLWTVPTGVGEARQLWGVADGKPGLLDTGAIDPALLRVRGDDASWRRDGVRRSVPLR